MTAKKFEPSAIQFAPIERNKLGGKYVPLANANGKCRITLQTPTMSLPFGVSTYSEKPDLPPTSYSVDLSFRGYETDENVLTLYNKLRELDAHLIDAAYANSVEWFGKQKSRELLADTYRPLTKEDPTGKYAPVWKIKIPMVDDRATGYKKPSVDVFDTNRNKIELEQIKKGSSIKVICEVASVWFVSNTQWGISFRAVQILVVSQPSRMTDFAFEADDGDAPAASPETTVSTDEDLDDDADMASKFL